MGSHEQRGEGEQWEGDVVLTWGRMFLSEGTAKAEAQRQEYARPLWLSGAGEGEILGPVVHGS